MVTNCSNLHGLKSLILKIKILFYVDDKFFQCQKVHCWEPFEHYLILDLLDFMTNPKNGPMNSYLERLFFWTQSKHQIISLQNTWKNSKFGYIEALIIRIDFKIKN